jgi:acetyl-CoA carboxylase carboxyl transferase subunit beta
MSWFARQKYSTIKAPIPQDRVPVGLCTKCPKCGVIMLTRDLERNLQVCLKCDYHLKMTAMDRIVCTVDEGTFVETHGNLKTADPLNFHDIRSYPEQIARYQQRTGLTEAIVTGYGKIYGIEASLGFMDAQFIAASMGSVVGEKVSRVFEHSLETRKPAVIFCAAGGARMQEGILSLMQMAKTSGMVAKMREARIPYVPVLTDPTGAGVAASFSSLGDLIIAEPGAMVYFAGPRVIEQTIRQVLPRGFQRAEFVQEHGFIDLIVHRGQMKATLASVLAILTHQKHDPIGEEEA